MGLTTQKNYRLFLYVNSFVIVLLGALISGWGVFLSFPSGLGEGYHNVQAMVREFGNVLYWRITVLYAVTALLIVLAMVVLHLLYSHRIAGPAYRISLEAGRISRGDLTGNIKFRRKDNLTDMADSLNDVALRYRGRVSAVKDCLARMNAQTKSASDLLGQAREVAALRKAADEITNTAKDIERILADTRT